MHAAVCNLQHCGTALEVDSCRGMLHLGLGNSLPAQQYANPDRLLCTGPATACPSSRLLRPARPAVKQPHDLAACVLTITLPLLPTTTASSPSQPSLATLRPPLLCPALLPRCRLQPQLLAIAAQNDVPAEPLETIGGGVMEWRRDRDRHLHLHSAFVAPHSSGPNGPMTTGEVLSLAGVLTKQSLPIHYKVTLDGGRTL